METYDEAYEDQLLESKRNSETLEKIRRKKDFQIQGFIAAVKQWKLLTAFQNLHDQYLQRRINIELKKLELQRLITERKQLKKQK